jgi:cytochrome c oxidase subunit II
MRIVIAFTMVLALSACGASDDLSPLAEEGKDLLTSEGCAACHGSEGEGGIGPALAGLPGRAVELDDGSIVIADTAYIRRGIVDPGAQITAGYEIRMPENTLTEAEVDAIVAWIEESS